MGEEVGEVGRAAAELGVSAVAGLTTTLVVDFCHILSKLQASALLAKPHGYRELCLQGTVE